MPLSGAVIRRPFRPLPLSQAWDFSVFYDLRSHLSIGTGGGGVSRNQDAKCPAAGETAAITPGECECFSNGPPGTGQRIQLPTDAEQTLWFTARALVRKKITPICMRFFFVPCLPCLPKRDMVKLMSYL